MIVCNNIYKQIAYDRCCDFRSEFLFEDEITRRSTRVLLAPERFGRYAYLSNKWFLEDASVASNLAMQLRLPMVWKDLEYDEFHQAVNKMASDWLNARICEMENDFSEIIYDPDTVFQQRNVRDMLLGTYNYGGAQIMRDLVLSFYRGETVELDMVILLDRKHYAIFKAILAHYRKYRKSEQLREIVNRIEAKKARAKAAKKTKVDDDLPY